MKYSFVLLAAAASVTEVSATFGKFRGFKGFEPYTCPGNTPNKCEDKVRQGLDFVDLIVGNVGKYNGFDFSGFKCEDRFSKRGLEERTFGERFDGRVIEGSCGPKKEETPAFGCDTNSQIDKFSVKRFDISVEFDCRMEFHYDMPDGSTCKHSADCSKQGTSIENTQCGGAKKVHFVYPKQEGKKDNCHIGVHHIDFDCEDNPPYVPPPPVYSPPEEPETPETPEEPVYTPPPTETPEEPETPEQPEEPVYTPPTETPEEPETPEQPEEPVYTPPTETPEQPEEPVYTPPTETPEEPETPEQPEEPVYTPPTETPEEPETPEQPEEPVYTPPTETPEEPETPEQPEEPVYTPPTETPETPEEPVYTPPTPEQPDYTPPATPEEPEEPVYTPPTPEQPDYTPPATPEEPETPEEPLPCPDVVPRCLNTWLSIKKECKDNTDTGCYCPSKEFVENVFSCLYAYGENDDEVAEAVAFFQGICAPHMPENPCIATGAETITHILTVTGTPVVPVEYTTVIVETTVTEPCVTDGVTITGSSTTVTVSTEVTVPHVGFTTRPGDDIAVVPAPPTTAPPAYPVPTQTVITAAPPAGTPGVVPPEETSPVVAGAGSVKAGLGLGLVMAIVAAL